MKLIKKVVTFILVTATLLVSTSFSVPKSSVFASIDPFISVRLSTMRNISSIKINVSGSYFIPERDNAAISRGQYTISISKNKIYLTSKSGTSYCLDKSFTLRAEGVSLNNYISVSNPSYGTCKYTGDMKISIEDKKLAFINTLHIEHYLMGVVPYEMSEAQAVESLKVQAIVARTYAMRIMEANRDNEYHVVDTTSNQVYKGYNSTRKKSIQAVKDTDGIILMYNDKIAKTYYSESNGGITESISSAWGGGDNVSVIREDPFDKHSSVVRRLSKTDISDSDAATFKSAAKKAVEAMGYLYDSVEIVSINKITPVFKSEPTSLSQSKRRTDKLIITLTVKAKADSSKKQTVSPNNDGYATFSVDISSTRGDSLRWFFSFSLPSALFTVQDNGNEFVFTAYGNGHAVGLSQSGTYARVKAGQNFMQILEFYFPKAKLSKMEYTPIKDSIAASGVSGDEMSQLSIFEIPYNAIIYTDSYIDVYSGAGILYERTEKLYNGTYITVLGESKGWYHIFTEDIRGYVKKDCVFMQDMQSPITQVPDVNSGNTFYIIATATHEFGLNVRNTPEINDINKIGLLSCGEKFMVIDKISDEWYSIYYGGTVGYVNAQYVEISEESYSIINKYATVSVSLATIHSCADNSASAVIGKLYKGSIITVIASENNGWYKILHNNGIAYISEKYVKLSDITPSNESFYTVNDGGAYIYSEPNTDAIRDTMISGEEKITGVVKQNGWVSVTYNGENVFLRACDVTVVIKDGSIENNKHTEFKVINRYGIVECEVLNVRSSASSNDNNIIGHLFSGDKVFIDSISSQWCTIIYKNKVAYVDASHIKFSEIKIDIPFVEAKKDISTLLGATSTSQHVSAIKKGDKYQLLGALGGCYRISFNNQLCYVSTQDTVVKNETITVIPSISKVRIVVSALNVRQGMSSDTQCVGVLQLGDIASITNVFNGWYEISYESNGNIICGYIDTSYAVIE
ncbi:MAG: SpoIID/LytB domain-containing protein [Clostridiales bacterium]|nr:SpoIID/LytB domain-containing protein [Clostridiales bacterium]